jgi:hypothetical protein
MVDEGDVANVVVVDEEVVRAVSSATCVLDPSTEVVAEEEEVETEVNVPPMFDDCLVVSTCWTPVLVDTTTACSVAFCREVSLLSISVVVVLVADTTSVDLTADVEEPLEARVAETVVVMAPP